MIKLDELPDFRNPTVPRQYYSKEWADTSIPYGVRISYMIPCYEMAADPVRNLRPIVVYDLLTDTSQEFNALGAVDHFGTGAVHELARNFSLYRSQYVLYYKEYENLVTSALLEQRRAEMVAKKSFSRE